MRSVRVVIASLTIVALLAAVAWAVKERGGGHVDTQSFRATEDPVSKTTTGWTTIRGLARTTSCPDTDAATATVSLHLAADSQAIDVRVVLDDISVECPDCPGPGDGVMAPKAVTLNTGGVEDSRSFTFVDEDVPGIHGTRFKAQWRLHPPVGPEASATLDAATLNILWDKTEARCAYQGEHVRGQAPRPDLFPQPSIEADCSIDPCRLGINHSRGPSVGPRPTGPRRAEPANCQQL